MRENVDKSNSEYGHFLRSEYFSVIGQSILKVFLKQLAEIETLDKKPYLD